MGEWTHLAGRVNSLTRWHSSPLRWVVLAKICIRNRPSWSAGQTIGGVHIGKAWWTSIAIKVYVAIDFEPVWILLETGGEDVCQTAKRIRAPS